MFCLTLVGTEWPNDLLLRHVHPRASYWRTHISQPCNHPWSCALEATALDGQLSVSVDSLRLLREGCCMMMSWYGYHVMVQIQEMASWMHFQKNTSCLPSFTDLNEEWIGNWLKQSFLVLFSKEGLSKLGHNSEVEGENPQFFGKCSFGVKWILDRNTWVRTWWPEVVQERKNIHILLYGLVVLVFKWLW